MLPYIAYMDPMGIYNINPGNTTQFKAIRVPRMRDKDGISSWSESKLRVVWVTQGFYRKSLDHLRYDQIYYSK